MIFCDLYSWLTILSAFEKHLVAYVVLLNTGKNMQFALVIEYILLHLMAKFDEVFYWIFLRYSLI